MKMMRMNLILASMFFWSGLLSAVDLTIVNPVEIQNRSGKTYAFFETKVPENHSYEGARYPSGLYRLSEDRFLIGNVNELLTIDRNGVVLNRIKMPSQVHVGRILYADETYFVVTSYTYDDDALFVLTSSGKILAQQKNTAVDSVLVDRGQVYLKAKGYSGTVQGFKFDRSTAILSKADLDDISLQSLSDPFIEVSDTLLLLLKYNNVRLIRQENGNSKEILVEKPIPIKDYSRDTSRLNISRFYDSASRTLFLFFGVKEEGNINVNGKYYFSSVIIE